MAAALLAPGSRHSKRSFHRRAASLIELLVVLFIIGIMLSLLLPALSGARSKANEVKCKNHLRQVELALSQFIRTTKKFPAPNRWTVEILRWSEEVPLYDALKRNTDPDPDLPRPAILTCPFQEDFPSRVASVGFCHFILTVDRPFRVRLDRWELHDRPLLSEDPAIPEAPWYVGPEQDFEKQREMFAELPGPHPDGKYMTRRGELVP